MHLNYSGSAGSDFIEVSGSSTSVIFENLLVFSNVSVVLSKFSFLVEEWALGFNFI